MIAKQRLKQFLDQAEHVRYTGEERHLWKVAVIEWVEFAGSAVKPSTLKRYKVSLRQINPVIVDGRAFEERYVDEIDRKLIAKVVVERKKVATNATIHRDLSALSSVLTVCQAKEWIEDNAAANYLQVNKAAIKERRDPIVLPEMSDIDYVVSRASGNFARMIRHAQYTGMREEECASLQHSQLRSGAADLTETKYDRPRSVPLDSRAVGTLSGTVRHLKSPYVFWHDDGARYHNVASQFADLVRRAEIAAEREGRAFRRFTFHHLRHWFAVDYLRRADSLNGHNIYALQKILGHRSIRTTEQYLDFLTPVEAERAKYGSAQKPAQI